jgi:hypothetical protein
LAKTTKEFEMIGRNKNAEMAFQMAMKLVAESGVELTDSQKWQIWTDCHNDRTILDAVNLYLYSTPKYAEIALAKLKGVLWGAVVNW